MPQLNKVLGNWCLTVPEAQSVYTCFTHPNTLKTPATIASSWLNPVALMISLYEL